MENLNKNMQQWLQCLNEWKIAVDERLIIVSRHGEKLEGLAWHTKVINPLNVVTSLLSMLTLTKEGFTDLKQLINDSRSLETVSGILSSITTLINSKDIRNDLTYGWSQLYYKSMLTIENKLETYMTTNKELYDILKDSAPEIGADFGSRLDIKDILTTHPTGGLPLIYYIGALSYHANQNDIIAKRELKNMTDTIFGLPCDTVELASLTAEQLKRYHPAQLMCYSAISIENCSDKSEIINMTFPQAKLSTNYHLRPLIDRTVASDYGPIATINTGLNHTLIDRLKTIEAHLITSNTSLNKKIKEKSDKAVINGSLFITTDNGNSVKVIKNDGKWAPFAGSRERVQRYHQLSENIILNEIKKDIEFFDVSERFKRAQKDEGECPSDIIIDNLVDEVSKLCELYIINDDSEFYSYIIGTGLPLYIITALIKIQSQKSININPKYICEGNITRTLQVLDASKSVWNKLKSAYHIDQDIFSVPEVRRKHLLVKAFSAIAKKALSNAQIIITSPSIKLFSLTN